MFGGLANSMLYAALKLTTVFATRDGSPIAKQGTAFFVQRADGAQCLVTNRHMLDVGYGDTSGKYLGAHLTSVAVETFIAKDDDVSKLPSVRIVFEVLLSSAQPKFATDYYEDVGVIVNPQVVMRGAGEPKVAFFLRESDLADDHWIESKLSICDFVAFPGFPPWHDQLESRPILRTGSISSDPRTNYSSQQTAQGRRVAFEAFSFGGSSGSPVIATQKGFTGTGGITVTGFRESKVIGINAGHLLAPLGQHSGVSYFIKASAILDLLRG